MCLCAEINHIDLQHFRDSLYFDEQNFLCQRGTKQWKVKNKLCNCNEMTFHVHHLFENIFIFFLRRPIFMHQTQLLLLTMHQFSNNFVVDIFQHWANIIILLHRLFPIYSICIYIIWYHTHAADEIFQTI